MMNRRIIMAGGLVLAANGMARAQAGGRPIVVLLGDQASPECKTWRTQWEPLFVKSDGYKKLDFRAIYPADGSLLLKQ